MKRLALMAALAAYCVPNISIATVTAKDVYAQGFGGVTISPTMNENADNSVGKVNNDNKAGYNAGLALGYHIDHAKFELQATYQRAVNKSLSVGSTSYTRARGSSSAVGALINGYYIINQLQPHIGVTPFIGAGLGYANVREDLNDPTSGMHLKGTDNALAYQVMTGFTFPLGTDVDVSMDYRFFGTSTVKLTASNSSGTEGNLDHYYQNNLFNLGLIYHFS
ncbi:MAG: outer membrane channel protein [marine bacterium B5-7]|nr:MAG: outer membrane channel protein [marine bacterium B5-7]